MIPALFFVEELEELSSAISNVTINEHSITSKVFMVIILIAYILIYLSLYYFKQILNDFLETHIFSDRVIENFKKTGNLLSTGGIMLVISQFIYTFLLGKFTLDFNNEQIIIICFGLFFQVLSEIFKISLSIKQENDLTV